MIRIDVRYGCLHCGSKRIPESSVVASSPSGLRGSGKSGAAAWTAVLLAGVAGLAGTAVLAQTYPVRPIQVVVPYGAGSNTDVIMRQLAPKMSEALGQPVIVDNRAGASGAIGTEAVAKSPPDGYRIIMGTSQQMGAAPFLYRNLPYDPIKDFAPIARVGGSILALAVASSAPYRNVADMVAYIKAHPEKANYASNGMGGTPHFAAVRFLDMAGLKATHVPYKGPALALSNVVSGQITFMFYPYPAMKGQVEGGLLRVLATTGQQRTSHLPQVPTLGESGFPGYVVQSWIAFYAPAGTPQPIVEKLNRAAVGALTDPELSRKLTNSGLTISTSSPDELARFTRSESDKFRKLVSLSGIKPE